MARGRIWTDEEDVQLGELHAKSAELIDMQARLRRSRFGVSSRLRELGLTVQHEQRPTGERDALIIERYLATASMMRVAREVGVGVSTVRRVLRRAGIVTTRKPPEVARGSAQRLVWTDAMQAELERLVRSPDAGSTREIADALGLNRRQVRGRLSRCQLHLRPYRPRTCAWRDRPSRADLLDALLSFGEDGAAEEFHVTCDVIRAWCVYYKIDSREMITASHLRLT